MISKTLKENIKLEADIFSLLKDDVSCSFLEWCIRQNIISDDLSQEEKLEAIDLINSIF